MSISPSQDSVHRVTECAICGSRQLESAIDLPQLPLTALYSPQPFTEPSACYKQELLVCTTCGHAQAGYQVGPSLLYGSEYGFRTSSSGTARRGTDFFVSALDQFAGSRRFKCALDWGCNDLYLLKRLENRADIRIGIDPIWKDREHEKDESNIQVIGATIESIDFSKSLSARPDLVVCRHTLEHIATPRSILHRLFEFAADDALFVFETPGFDALVHRYRFDQVFHQHLQYFNLTTFQRLIIEIGAEYLGFRENYHDWGALLVAFQKSGKRTIGQEVAPAPFDLSEIHARYQVFRHQLSISNEVLQSFAGTTIYGYGAAQMLPVLAYHMTNDLASLTAILDDDPSRDGWYYRNLIPPIWFSGKATDLQMATVLVTAVDNIQPILSKLLAHRPKHILIPFNLF
jgi:hypothetical protein